jgi:uncharacterized protein with FMN-binding domain
MGLAVLVACASVPADDSDTLIQPGPVDAARLSDGTFVGSVKQGPNRAIVEVDTRDGRIVEVRIVKHSAMKGVIAEEPVTHAIVETQSTQVDIVTGATNSSEVLMKASQAAVERAYGDRD